MSTAVSERLAEPPKAGAMGNTNWAKVFYAIQASGLPAHGAVIKYLWQDSPYSFTSHPDVRADGKGTLDGKYAPVAFETIQWICFCPKDAVVLEKLEALLHSLGQFETQRTVDGIRLYGYK